MEIEEIKEIKHSASFVIFGLTGSGKSTFGNRLLGKEIFKVNSGVESETIVTRGEFGIFDERPIYVVDTPGLQDSEGRDQQHLDAMTDFIKNQPVIQAFVFIIDFKSRKIDNSVIKLFQLVKKMYPEKKWYHNIAIVWSKHKYDNYKSNEYFRTIKMNGIKSMIKTKVVTDITDEELNAIPQYFVDNKEDNSVRTRSYEEINRLLDWISGLESLNLAFGEIRNVDNDTMFEVTERKRILVADNLVETIKIRETALCERKIKTLFSGKVFYTDWVELEGTRLQEKIALIEPPPDVQVEYDEEVILSPEYEQIDNIIEFGRRFMVCGPRNKIVIGRVMRNKKTIKRRRYLQTFYDDRQ